VNGIERSQARGNTVRHIEILLFRAHAPHQLHHRTAPLVVQIGEIRKETKRVGVDVQIRCLVLLIAEGIDIPPAVAELQETFVVGWGAAGEAQYRFVDRRPRTLDRTWHRDPGLEKVLIRPGDWDIEQMWHQHRLKHLILLRIHSKSTRQTETVRHEDTAGQIGQRNRDVERHLVVAVAGVVPGDE
jgi:hypothetical protein